jgi:hypothetical protein
MKVSRLGPGSAIAGAIVLLFACGDRLRQEELDCEEAVSHLTDCCAGFGAQRVQCIFEPGCESGREPDILQSDSSCIRARSCSELASTGVCERASNAWPRGNVPATGSWEVCP